MTTGIESSPLAVPPMPPLPNRAIRTLLAEDSPFLMRLLAAIVARHNRVFIVGSAPDGRKAVYLASRLQPDLVVIDLHMPGLDGAEATRLLKKQSNPPVIIVVTSDDTPEARTQTMAAGADGFVVKAGNLGSRLLSLIVEFFPDDIDMQSRGRKKSCEYLIRAS